MRAEVDVYCFPLNVEESSTTELSAHLSPDERKRADRFRFDRDRKTFIVCRGTLRQIIGGELSLEPSEVQFVYGDFGKPALEFSNVRFNVSHSHELAIIAITRGREVGCDIERIDPSFAQEQIPERFFSPYEVSVLRSLPAAQQTEAFFRCWTRKEAFIKACGLGLSLPLGSFDVTLSPDQPAELLRGADGWSLQCFPVPSGYAAAIVAQGHDWTIRARPGI